MGTNTKIIIGTANFATEYGILKKKPISLKNISKIFTFCKNSKIKFIDTAKAYGNCEEKIGKLNLKNFKVITKLQNCEKKKIDHKQWVRNQIFNSLKLLNINSLYGVLLHKPLELLKPGGKEIYSALKKLKLNGYIKKIGFSINSPNDLDLLFKKFKPDIVQSPLNIFDRRIVESGWLSRLSSKNIEVHARSIFLQGLLLKERKKIPSKFAVYNKFFINWHNWLYKNNQKPLEACLNFIFSQKKINQIVIGIDNLEQLKIILKHSYSKKDLPPKNLSSKSSKLISPSEWKNL